MKREIRFIAELRAAEGDELALVGYAAKFNSESKDLGGFRETVAPGAFTRSIADNADVKCAFNHDANRVLGRTKSGTLKLEQDTIGLKFRCELDATSQLHRDVYASVKRGDIDECSFAFMVGKDGQRWEMKGADEAAYPLRTLLDVDLKDVAVVTYPAYNTTSVDARSLFPDGEIMEIRSAITTLQAEKRTRDDSFEAQYWTKREAMEKALLEKFGFTEHGYRKYYLMETYADHIIVCTYDDDYNEADFSIPYTADGQGGFTFGEPKPVELDWVASTRSKQIAAESRADAISVVEKRKAEAVAAAAAQAAQVPATENAPAPAADTRAADAPAETPAPAAAGTETPAPESRSACDCDCSECEAGDCENCSCEDCDCDGCECNMRKAKLEAETRAAAPMTAEEIQLMQDRLKLEMLRY